MKLLQGKRFADIAEELGTTEAACKMRLQRAVRGASRTSASRGSSRVSDARVKIGDDPELVELFVDDPGGLAIADAVATTQERPRSSARAVFPVATPGRGGEP